MIPKPKHLEIYTAIFAGITFHSCPQNINMGGGEELSKKYTHLNTAIKGAYIESPSYTYIWSQLHSVAKWLNLNLSIALGLEKKNNNIGIKNYLQKYSTHKIQNLKQNWSCKHDFIKAEY